MKNHMKLNFLGISANENFARSVAGAFASQLDPTLDEISDIKTAVSEAVTNCIIHAYRDKTGEVALEMELEEDTVRVAVEDKGVGIKDVEQARQPFFTTVGGEERSGMGFTVMETFMDEVKVVSKPGYGTIVIMYKKIKGRVGDGIAFARADA
jgi:stage II sporulation protein AB (anti-sigma F factor)